MVGVPSALYLAAGLLAFAASVGLSFALLAGRGPADGQGGRLRLVGVLGAAVYAVGFVLAGGLIGPVELRVWTQVAGLAGILVGVGAADVRAAGGLGLVVGLAPTLPSTVAAGLAGLSAARIATGGRAALLLSGGLGAMGVAHVLEPTRPTLSAIATIIGALLVDGWLLLVSSRRILARLLTAFAAALLAMAITLAAVLSTVSTAQLTSEELDRLDRLAGQLTAQVQTWPADAIQAAQPLSRSVSTLVGTELTPLEAADLYALSLSSQDFFVAVDATGRVVNSHPESLGGAITLALAGDPLVQQLREGAGPGEAGGLVSSGQTVVGFGAVALVAEDARPEAPPSGVLVTGRLVDGLWAAQQSVALDVGVIGVVGGEVVFSTGRDDDDATPADAEAVVEGLGDRSSADLGVDGQVLFAAAAPLIDPERGVTLGRLVTTSTPQVIAALDNAQARRLFTVTLLGGALALLAAAVVTRRFVRPIAQLTAVAERVGAGDLTGRSGVVAPDEVGLLAATFDEMVESLAEQRQDLTSSALRESRLRGRLESLTTSMSDGLIAVDAQGTVITFNPSAEQLTGRRATDAVGSPLDEVLVGSLLGEGMPDTDAPTDPLQLHNAVDPTTAAARLMLRQSDGGRVPIAASAAPVRSPNGEIIGRVYVLRDITADLQVEQMKTQFLANVSHELRTPITPIKGYANVLARRDVGPDATKRFAEQILDSTRRLERIVAMIVDFAALDSGRVTFDPATVEVATLLEETLDSWRRTHPGREFHRELAPGLPPVRTDAAYLRRCLDELLDNAVKFSPDGQAVSVRAVAVPGEGRVQLSVRDQGIGIEPEAAKRLFTDFVQADGTETRHYGGLGLGLGLVARILEGIGATVQVESVPGEGTTVTLGLDAAGPPTTHVVPAVPAPPMTAAVPPPPG